MSRSLGTEPIDTEERYSYLDQLVLGTIISKRTTAKTQNTAETARLRKIQHAFVSSGRLVHAARVAGSLSEALGLPGDCRTAALEIIRRAMKHETTIPSTDLAGAAIFYAAKGRTLQKPTTLRQIAKTQTQLGHRTTFGKLSRALIFLESELGLKLPRIKSEDYLRIILDKLAVNKKLLAPEVSTEEFVEHLEKLESFSRDLLSRLDGSVRGGRNPYVFAASTLYFVGRTYVKDPRIRLSQRCISYATGVAEYTLREHFAYIRRL